jgi:hypothetical protein
LTDEFGTVRVFEKDILIVTVCVDLVRVFGILLVRQTDSRIDKGYIVLLVLVQPVDERPVLCFAE